MSTYALRDFKVLAKQYIRRGLLIALCDHDGQQHQGAHLLVDSVGKRDVFYGFCGI